MAKRRETEFEQIDFLDLNGPEKLSLDSQKNREQIIQHYAENGEAIFYCSHSGGVDSCAQFETLSKLVRPEQLVIIHASLGRYEHRNIIPYIQQNINGHDLIVVKQKTRSLMDSVLLRGMWMSSMARYCTSGHKQSPIYAEIRADFARRQAANPKLKVAFNCTGIVAVESPARAKKNPLNINKSLTTKTRLCYDYMPVYHMDKEQIWETIKAAGKKPHEVYGETRGEGNDRLSCSLCFLASQSDLERGATLYPDIYYEYIAAERLLKHTMFGKTKQKTHYDDVTDLITGEIKKVKRVEKTFIQIPLEEKIGLPVNEEAVAWYMKKHEKRRAELLAIKAAEETEKDAKRAEEKKLGSGKKKAVDTSTIAFNFG